MKIKRSEEIMDQRVVWMYERRKHRWSEWREHLDHSWSKSETDRSVASAAHLVMLLCRHLAGYFLSIKVWPCHLITTFCIYLSNYFLSLGFTNVCFLWQICSVRISKGLLYKHNAGLIIIIIIIG